MAMRAFNFTMPANANYASLWSKLSAVTGFAGNDLCYELIIYNGATAILLSDANNANCAGIPIAANGNITFRSTRNTIDLKAIYVSGTSAPISGWISWM